MVHPQRSRPEAQPQVIKDDARLGAGVGPGGRRGEIVPGVRHPAMAQQQVGQQAPSGGQGGVESPPPPQCLAEGAGQKRAVVKQHHQRRRDHDFLARHAQEAGQHGGGVPEERAPPIGLIGAMGLIGPIGSITPIGRAGGLPPRARRAANHAVERQQVEQAHQRLGPLHDVGDRFGLQRMHRPEQADRRSQPGG